MLGPKPQQFDMRDFKSQPIALCGKSFIADVSGALYWPSERALLVADMHLEKGSAFAVKGQMVPPYDTRETLTKLASAIDRYNVETVIALGDSFQDSDAASRMIDEDLRVLKIIQEGRLWLWITGNHDPEISDHLGGRVLSEVEIEGITLRHHPKAGQITHEIAGHLHPASKLSVYGTSLRRPCFISNRRRLILPAFGTYTGGLNVLDDAFMPLFNNDGFSVWMLGHDGLYPVATRQLIPD